MVEASQKLRELLQPSLARWAGILGDFDGNIESDRPNEVYVRLRQAGSTSYVVGSFKVRGALRLWLNLPVWVALDPVTGEQYIDGADTDMMAYSSATQDAGMATLPLHAPSHDWRATADDQLQWLHTLQIYSVRVQPGDTTGHVDVQKGIYFAGGELVFKSAATDLDLTSYYPASGSALVKVCIDKDDVITVIQGAGGSDAMLFSQLEATPADNYALAVARLTFGAEILWAQADGGDIYDLRFVNEITTTVFDGGEVVIADGVVKAGFNIDSINPARWVEMGDMVIPTPYCGLVTDETVVGFSALWDGSYLRLYMKETAAVPAGYLAFSDNQDLLIGACDSLGFTTLIEIDGAGVNFMQFNPAYVAAGHSEGRVHWNPNEYTLDIETGLGPILQVGQEVYILIYNDTGFQIDNLTVLRPKGATIVSGEVIVTVEKAIADTFEGCEGTIMVATMDIPDSTIGLATRFGRARAGNTAGFTPGASIFLSDTVAGEFTETRPEFPSYDISLGGVLKADALEGEIIVSVTRDIFDTTLNFWNGVVRETIDFLITSDGATVTGTLTAATGAGELTLIFSDGYFLLDVSTPPTIALTAGTDDEPQPNYVYIPSSTKVLTVSTSDWPITEHAKIATVVLRSAAATQSDGALRNQNWNDHIADADDFMGHLSDIGERIRQDAAKWDTGVEGSVVIDTGPTPDDVWAKVTGGIVYQLHRQTFPIVDMTQYGIDAVSTGSKTFTISGDGDLSSTFPDGREIKVNGSTGNDGRYTIVSTLWSDPDFIITVDEAIPSAVADGTIGDDIHVVNDNANPYTTILNFNQLTSDALGGSLTNSSFSVVMWGVQNKNGETCHLMLNLPTDSYGRLRPDDAVNDANNYSVYTIPKTFQGVGFLIARFTLTLTASGNDWTLYATEDLRGFTPNTAAGGGAGGVGVTTFLALTDTPSAYTGLGSSIVNVNAGATALEFAAGMFWDSAGSRAGVGIAPTDGTLHVHTATAGSVTADTNFDDLVVENNANTGATFLAPDANTAGIAFGSPTDNYGAFVSWGYDSDLMAIGTNKAGAEIAFYTALTAEAMRIDASGNVNIVNDGAKLTLGAGADGEIFSSGDDLYIKNVTLNRHIYVNVNDGGVDKNIMFVEGHTGDIGFGTQTPSQPLHIYKNENDQAYVLLENADAAGGSAVAGFRVQASTALVAFLSHGAGRGAATRYGITLANYSDIVVTAGNGLLIGTGTLAVPIIFGTNSAERMRIDSAGNIGMSGVTSPASALDIGAGALTIGEMSAPSGVASSVLLYAVDNGGKTELYAIFQTGAAQLIAAEL